MIGFHPQPKPRPRLLEKRDRTAAIQAADRRGSDAVRQRSQGLCERVETIRRAHGLTVALRCHRRAVEVHHLIGGHGKRGRGASAEAVHKIHLCPECHTDIHGHVLQRVGEPVPVWTDRWERVR